MATGNVKPLDVISEEQYEKIKEKQDWRNILSISFNWLQMAVAMVFFFYYPNVVTFLLALVIIGSKQFALAVLAHDAAHNLHYILKYHIQKQCHLGDMWTNVLKN